MSRGGARAAQTDVPPPPAPPHRGQTAGVCSGKGDGVVSRAGARGQQGHSWEATSSSAAG